MLGHKSLVTKLGYMARQMSPHICHHHQQYVISAIGITLGGTWPPWPRLVVNKPIEVFFGTPEVDIIGIRGIKNSSKIMLPPVGIEPLDL